MFYDNFLEEKLKSVDWNYNQWNIDKAFIEEVHSIRTKKLLLIARPK